MRLNSIWVLVKQLENFLNKFMIEKLEKNPFWFAMISFLLLFVISKFVDESDKFLIGMAVISGVMAFANTLWLTHRLNRLSDVLEEKGIANRYELLLDEKIREIILKKRE